MTRRQQHPADAFLDRAADVLAAHDAGAPYFDPDVSGDAMRWAAEPPPPWPPPPTTADVLDSLPARAHLYGGMVAGGAVTAVLLAAVSAVWPLPAMLTVLAGLLGALAGGAASVAWHCHRTCL